MTDSKTFSGSKIIQDLAKFLCTICEADINTIVVFYGDILVTATSSQRAARSCSGITSADNADLVSFQQSYNLVGEFPKC
jgi:hypothetical protein